MELLHDPVEDTEEYLKIKDELEEKLEVYRKEYKAQSDKVGEEFGVYPPICHKLWYIKRKILLEDYGIEWRSPSAMNPDVNFD